MTDGLQPAAVLDALKRVVDPEFGKDLVALGMAKQVTVAEGRVAVGREAEAQSSPPAPVLEARQQVVVPLREAAPVPPPPGRT